ncbi:progranulin-like [Pollicipes pollicipes]|uniref:progranulin-like n=1 Tax=Pollicipes pollicipes TaxID=41117 RepID=UPI001885431B|nr:progranulin-like [Pollicipes pollicipes]
MLCLSEWLLLAIVLHVASVEADRCPNGDMCEGDTTCCATDSHQLPFRCCPYVDAVCCSDRQHCCRKGYSCDPSGDRCVRVSADPVLCPDGESRCPAGATCCLMSDQRWGCCPLRDAVCCSDRVHCCPRGTQCDLQTLTCLRTEKRHWLLEMLAERRLGPVRMT